MKRVTGGKASSSTTGSAGGSSRLYKGIAVGLLLPAVVLGVVLIRQFGGETKVAASDGGAPLEVAVREVPVVAAPKSRVILNRTINFNKTNPYARAKPVAKAPKRVNTLPKLQKNQSLQILKPWDLREVHASKQKAKSVKNSSSPMITSKVLGSTRIEKKSKTVTPKTGTHATTSDTDSGKLVVAAKKPKKVFAASERGKGYLPGEEVLPRGGTPVSSLLGIQKWIAKTKCVALVAFYNSEDFAKSRELASVWTSIQEQYKDKFNFGLCDTQYKNGMEVAVAAGVFPTANDTVPAIGLPSILMYPTKAAINETVTVLRGSRAKKTTSAATPSVVSKKLITILTNLELTLSKDGCYAPAKTPFSSKTKLATAIVDHVKFSQAASRLPSKYNAAKTLSTKNSIPPKELTDDKKVTKKTSTKTKSPSSSSSSSSEDKVKNKTPKKTSADSEQKKKNESGDTKTTKETKKTPSA